MNKAELIVEQIRPNVERAWRAAAALCAGRPYAFGLFTTAEADYVVPTINDEAGLDRTVARYTKDKDLAALHRDSLRWSPPDWPHHGEPMDALKTWSTVWRPFAGPRTLHGALLATLKVLDDAQVFGSGEDREALTLGLFLGDQSDAQRLANVKKVNPPAVVARFKDEQKRQRAAWKQLAKLK